MSFPKALSAVIGISVILTGCGSLHTSQPKRHVQRFVPIPAGSVMTQGVPWNGFFALDTETGELCTTVRYDLLPKGPADDLEHSLLGCSNILRAEKEAVKH